MDPLQDVEFVVKTDGGRDADAEQKLYDAIQEEFLPYVLWFNMLMYFMNDFN